MGETWFKRRYKTNLFTIATKAHLCLVLLTIGPRNSRVSSRCTTLIKRTSNAQSRRHRPNRVRASNGNESRAGSKDDFITELSTRVRCCLPFDTISLDLIGWGSPVSRKHPSGCWDKVWPTTSKTFRSVYIFQTGN